MLYWLLMMIIMVIISNNDKLQIVSASCIRRLVQTMIWLTVGEFYLTVWPILMRKFNTNNTHHLHHQLNPIHQSISLQNQLAIGQQQQHQMEFTSHIRASR